MRRALVPLAMALAWGCSAAADDAITSESFCEDCIERDRAHCEFWADRRSQSFLIGYQKCGDEPACLKQHLLATGPDAAQCDYANAYCSACAYEGCESTFFDEGHPGYALLEIGGVGLESVRDACIPVVQAAASQDLGQCAPQHESCVLDYRLDDSRSGGLSICRVKVEEP